MRRFPDFHPLEGQCRLSQLPDSESLKKKEVLRLNNYFMYAKVGIIMGFSTQAQVIFLLLFIKQKQILKK